jgi:hypothetical protein
MEQNDLIAATLRLPPHIHEQVVTRAKINRRTKNAELIVLIEAGIDAGTSADLKLIESIKRKDPL